MAGVKSRLGRMHGRLADRLRARAAADERWVADGMRRLTDDELDRACAAFRRGEAEGVAVIRAAFARAGLDLDAPFKRGGDER